MSRPVLIATALSYNSMSDVRLFGSWLQNWYQHKQSHPPGVYHFAAFEFDGRGRGTFRGLETELRGMDETCWYYGLDDGRTRITQTNRLRHFVYGQNLCIERALELDAHLLYVGAGITLPPDIVPKLLEPRLLAIGPYVPAYAQRGPASVVNGVTVENALPAGAIFLHHDLLAEGIRWRSHSDGLSDDFGLRRDLLRRHNVSTYVRTDCIAHKYPPAAVPVEQRGYDLNVYW